MPRRRNGRSSRHAVVYIHVPAVVQEVKVIIEMLMVETTQNESNSVVNCPDENVALPQRSEDFDGIELHGDEFVFD